MLATKDDVKRYLGITGSDGVDGVVSMLLAGVTSSFEGEVGTKLEPVEVTEIAKPNGLEGLALANPVVRIRSVTDGNSTVATTGYRLEGRILHRLSDGFDIAWGNAEVTVVYVAGFDPTPPDLRMAAITQAAFEYKQASGTTGGDRLGLRSNSPSQAGEAVGYVPHDLLPQVSRTLRRYRSLF